MSNSVRPHRQQPTRLRRPWDSPGKNTGVGCHCLLQCMKVKSASEVAQSCPTLSDPMDCSPPGSSVHGVFQARVLEWGAIAFSDINDSIAYFSLSSLYHHLESLPYFWRKILLDAEFQSVFFFPSWISSAFPLTLVRYLRILPIRDPHIGLLSHQTSLELSEPFFEKIINCLTSFGNVPQHAGS